MLLAPACCAYGFYACLWLERGQFNLVIGDMFPSIIQSVPHFICEERMSLEKHVHIQ
jgi:hypothetical protein